jgi:hypothetical protein
MRSMAYFGKRCPMLDKNRGLRPHLARGYAVEEV